MRPTNLGSGRLRRRSGRRRLRAPDSDPLSLLINFFDCGVVFSLAFLLAAHGPAADAAKASGGEASREAASEAVPAHAKDVTRFRETRDSLRGKGTRLGVAYRLASGEVVYVPEAPAEASPRDVRPR